MYQHLNISITLQGVNTDEISLDDVIRSEDVAGRVGVLIGEGYREGSFDFSISDEPMSVAWNCTMAETSE
ncbi:hypothetical protein ACB381_18240 [Klebsiella michiganensis]|uniref:hypothetical protein n=1 Tax=Klebsiella/Raoultella group TaxID=2890311 RepID=UPI00064B29FC|nr:MULTISPECIES: hypothetical protein [Klebsiella]AKL03805.1 hypothetical protein AB184_00555 [Klebsiella oxytoca]AKL20815.1 hypothetical protein AB181_01280 [Klebsiella oxytoca]APB48283.1 hypothetical protein AGF18_30420 [Klebsiella oxytoca]ELK6574824.1 hypothetical protein [Klebsiella michiganensis]HAU6254575.1 hypothetical protein [Klebsiella oxytoca]